MKPFFSYSPEAGFEFHDTEYEARERAAEELLHYRDGAKNDGWVTDEVESICCGEVRWCAKMIRDEEADSGEFDRLQDYALLENK